MGLGPMRIKPKLLLLLFLINLAFTLAFSCYYYNRQRDAIVGLVDEQLTTAAYGVSHIIPSDFYDRFETRDSLPTAEARRYLRILTRYADQTGLTYLYVCVKLEDQIIFAASSIAVKEIQDKTQDDFFDNYDTAPPALHRVFAQGKTEFAQYTDIYGTFRSVFIPFTTPRKKTYVIGADISLAFLDAQLWATLRHTAIIGLSLFLISFLIEYVMIDHIVNPLVRLKGYTRVLVDQDFKLGDEVLQSMDGIAQARQGEVSELAGALRGMYDMLQRHIVELQATTAAREAVESELRIARSIQTSLLPHTFPPFPQRREFDLHAINVPAKYVAGDFFDFYFLSDHQLLVTIADVSGKGVPAGLFMAVTRTLLKNLIQSGLGPAEAFTKANNILAEDNERGMFVTIFLGIYDTHSGALRYANGGHNAPYRVDRNGALGPPMRGTGPALGILPDRQYEEREIRLDVGDLLVLYTDGVTEAHSSSNELYGDERFEALLGQHAGEAPAKLCDIIVRAVNDFQGEDQFDDITLVVLRRNE
ncbi:MAG: PP2C family protein-serine/threonine phosphatase [Planctomycetota bacterium]